MRFRIALMPVLAMALLRGDNQQPEAQLVDLAVIAVDIHGQPVTDLTRNDFQVTDAGKPQKIAFFRLNDSQRWQAPSLGPNEFSNRGRSNVPRATVILFDLLNERFGTRGTASNQLIHYLESLESADYLYLYLFTLDGRLYAVHGLPGAEEGAKPPGAAPWTRQIKPLLDESLRTVTHMRPVDIDVAVRVQLTYQVLEVLAAQLSAVPGRKNIVWITDGVPIALGPIRSDTGEFVDFTPLLRQLSAALDRSEIAIYPVRQVMLGSPDAMGAFQSDPQSAANGGGPPGGNQSVGNINGLGSVDTLDQFAGMTGGRPDAGKDIGGAITQAMHDVRTGYQIGYYPPSRSWDSKFHKLRVTCTRKGVKVQAKTGYYAWPEPPEARARQAIDVAAATTFDAAEIGLRAALLTDPKMGRSARLEARIDANDIALARDQDQYTGELWLALVSYPDGQPPVASQFASMDLRYSAQERDQALKEGIPFARDMNIPENVTAVRLIVFDRGSDTVGSVSVPVQFR